MLPNLQLAEVFGTRHIYEEKLAGAAPLANRLAVLCQPVDPCVKLAEDIGKLLAKQAGVGSTLAHGAGYVAKLPFHGIAAGGRMAMKHPAIALGAGIGTVGLAAGYTGGKSIEALGNLTSEPKEASADLEKQAIGFAPMMRGIRGGTAAGLRGMSNAFGQSRSSGTGLFGSIGAAFKGFSPEAAPAYNKAIERAAAPGRAAFNAAAVSKSRAEMPEIQNRVAETKAKLQEKAPQLLSNMTPARRTALDQANAAMKPAVQPPKQPRMSSAQRRNQAMGVESPVPQKPTTQASAEVTPQKTPTPTPPSDTVGQVQSPSTDQVGNVATPQPAQGKGRWSGLGVGLGLAGVGVGAGAAMMGGQAFSAMSREPNLRSTYGGYGAPVIGSPSPYGYASGPAM